MEGGLQVISEAISIRTPMIICKMGESSPNGNSGLGLERRLTQAS